MNPIAIAVQGKGALNAFKRACYIGRRYGLAPDRMDRALAHFVGILSRFGARATFPITGAALARCRGIVEKYESRSVEFAVHGYCHVDHSRLSLNQQLDHFARARRLFHERGLECHGFRSPYLRFGQDTLAAIRQAGFAYDSSQSLAWPVLDGHQTAAYSQALGFYGALPAGDYPALPRLDEGVVEIPYTLPDDESLVERCRFGDAAAMSEPWRLILMETHRLGELFTLGLHPERIHPCEQPLSEVLHAAATLSPPVWFARLEEISRWWVARTDAEVTVEPGEGGEITVRVRGPEGTVILARGVGALSPVAPWDGVYQQSTDPFLRFRSDRRPFVAISSASSPRLASFLRQQGYIVERAADGRNHTLFLDLPGFDRRDERALLARIEQGSFPLVRLGRWPNGARSTLCVTGDIDALTIWDYNLRLLCR